MHLHTLDDSTILGLQEASEPSSSAQEVHESHCDRIRAAQSLIISFMNQACSARMLAIRPTYRVIAATFSKAN